MTSLESLVKERELLLQRLQEIDKQIQTATEAHFADKPTQSVSINKFSPVIDKINLYRSLFRGRQDVFAKRFESAKTGKSGYQPVCENEWRAGVCEKPKAKCAQCPNRKFVSFDNSIIEKHLRGVESFGKFTRPFVAGIYPLLSDDCCYFLAVDFDEETWVQDSKAFIDSCKAENIHAYLERSRSGNGGHV